MGAAAAPTSGDASTHLFGAMPEAIATRSKSTVVVVKTREPIGRQTFEQLAAHAETLAAADRAAEEARAIPTRVDRWFGESNFHHGEFSDLRRLVQLKEKQGITISLVLPTLNEEETIGPIVRRAIREMVGRVPLLDEILVIDSGVHRPHPRDRRGRGRPGHPAPRRPRPLRVVPRQGRGALEVALRDVRRHRGVGRHGREELAPADGLRDARAAPPRAAAAVRQGLLPAPDRRGRRAPRGRRRPRHGARRAAADQPLLPRALGLHPAARRGVRRAPLDPRADARSSPAMPSRSVTSSTSPSGPASTASARWTSSGASIATRSSKACRG